jgi:hypothetical protein
MWRHPLDESFRKKFQDVKAADTHAALQGMVVQASIRTTPLGSQSPVGKTKEGKSTLVTKAAAPPAATTSPPAAACTRSSSSSSKNTIDSSDRSSSASDGSRHVDLGNKHDQAHQVSLASLQRQHEVQLQRQEMQLKNLNNQLAAQVKVEKASM